LNQKVHKVIPLKKPTEKKTETAIFKQKPKTKLNDSQFFEKPPSSNRNARDYAFNAKNCPSDLFLTFLSTLSTLNYIFGALTGY